MDNSDATTDSSGAADGGDQLDGPQRCDYCRLRLPAEPATTRYEEIPYAFCSDACRTALEDSERSFTTYHGFRRFSPGVAAMDAGLPEGMPRNTFVLLSSQSGTREEAVHAELVWRTLQRGEPAVIVSFLETPTSIVQEFVHFDWNVLPYLESGQLHVLDCFTYQLEDGQEIVNRMNAFNRHLHDVVSEATTVVRDPTDVTLVRSRLGDCLDELGMSDRGIVAIDSLTELGTLVQPVKAYDFVKSVRADVAKGRFVPVFAGATRTRDKDRFPHDLEYMVDGVVDLRFTQDQAPDTLFKQLRIRKMTGVLTVPEWNTYEYTVGDGMITFDPNAKAPEADEDAEEPTEHDDTESDADPATTEDGEDPATPDDGKAPATAGGNDGPAATADRDSSTEKDEPGDDRATADEHGDSDESGDRGVSDENSGDRDVSDEDSDDSS